MLLRTSDGFVHNHTRDGLSVLFLLGGVNAMGLWIDGQTVDSMLDAKIFELAVMIWIVLVAEVLEGRAPFYQAAAQIIVDTTYRSVDQVVELVLAALKSEEAINLGG